jgi:hypothetical protein
MNVQPLELVPSTSLRSIPCLFTHALPVQSVARQPAPYTLADLQQPLEVLARAADALGKAPIGVTIRQRIERPSKIDDDDWFEFLEAHQTRIRQLDESLEERRQYRLRDDPVFELQNLLNKDSGS